MATSYFLHAADLHLGAQLNSLGQHLDDGRVAAIRQLVSVVFDDLIDVAIERNVEFVVLAGDVYDTAENDPSAKLRVVRGFRRLEQAGIRVFVVHGNHDPLGPKMKQVDDLPSNVHVFGYGEVGQETLTLQNGVAVTVAGISYKTEKESENLAQKFASVTGSTVVGVLHTNVGNIGTAGGHGNYAPCSQDDLKNSPVNYWALGHIHDRQVVQTPKGYWAYPGNLQGRSTKATECGSKGVLVVGINDAGAILEPEFVAVDRVRFHRLDVNVNDCSSAIQAFDKAASQIEHLVNDSDGRPALVRLEFTGPTDAFDDLQTHNDSLLNDVRDHVASVIGSGDVLKVINSTIPNVDPQEVRKRNTVLAAALLALDESDAPEHVRAEAERLLIEKLAVQA